MKYLKTYFESKNKFTDSFNENIVKHFNEVSEEIIDVIDNIKNNEEDIEIAINKIDFLIEGSGIERIDGNQEDKYWDKTKVIYINIGDPNLESIFYNIKKEKFSCTTYNKYMKSLN